jgi:hypothetical protein
MRRRVAPISALALAAALALSGCVVFTGGVSGVQQDLIGKLRLTLTICASGRDDGPQPPPPDETEDHPGCPDAGDSGQFADDGTGQVMLGFRVPTGTGVPSTIAATPAPAPPASGPLTFRRNASYASELQRAFPAAAGFQWVGYMSDPYAFSDGADDVPAQSAQVTVDLTLPRGADGGPFIGPFRVRPVVGARAVDADQPASRPVFCGNPDLLPVGIVCVDSPATASIPSSLQFATRDFGIVAGKATASPGQSLTLPFDARLVGALPAGTTFTIAASTSLPGVQAKPSVASLAPAPNSNTRITVPVSIPKTAGPGVYDFTLTARLPNGQARAAVAKLTVRDRQNPVLSGLKVRPKRVRPGFRVPAVAAARGARVSYSLNEPAAVRVAVQRCAKRPRQGRGKRCVRYATLRGAFTRASTAGTNGFRFTGFLRGRRLRAGAYRLTATPTDAAGNRGAIVRVAFGVRR